MAIFSDQPLLSALSPDDRDLLLGAGSPRVFESGRPILRQGDTDTHVVAITQGWTVVRAEAGNGRSVIFGLRGPMDVVGEFAALDGAPRSATVSALTEVRARSISARDFGELVRRRPALAEAVTRCLVSRLRAADHQNQVMATLPVLQRLARLLLDLAVTGARGQVASRLTQQEMAEAIGAGRDAVAKALADLRARNVVGSADRRVVVRDVQALRAIADL